MPAFKLPKLPARLRALGRSKTSTADKGKKPAKELTPMPNNSLDIDNADFELEPSDFNPFDQPDMALTLNGCAPTKSHLDRYSIVESPSQTLSDYLEKSDLKRVKSLRSLSEAGSASNRVRRTGSGSFQRVPVDQVSKIEKEAVEEPLHQRVQNLRMEDKSLSSQMVRESRPKTVNGKPAPNFERIRGHKVYCRGEERYPSTQPLKVVRPKPSLLPLREEQEYIVPVVTPYFDKPVSPLAESYGDQLRGTAQQTSQPKMVEASTSLKVAMNTPTRPPMPKTPDSAKSGMGVASQEDSKGKGKASDEDSQVVYAQNNTIEATPLIQNSQQKNSSEVVPELEKIEPSLIPSIAAIPGSSDAVVAHSEVLLMSQES